jgi:hypothetical protein
VTSNGTAISKIIKPTEGPTNRRNKGSFTKKEGYQSFKSQTFKKTVLLNKRQYGFLAVKPIT